MRTRRPRIGHGPHDWRRPQNKALMDVVEGCVDNGVLVLTANGLLRLLPPLNIPWDELKEAINIVKKVIDK